MGTAIPGIPGHLIFTKTRLAPTPSGFLHLGNIFSFVLTAFLARHTGARIMLRIDDYDRERIMPQYVKDIFDTLHFLEIPWEEGPDNPDDFANRFAQRHRQHVYQDALQHLMATGQVFACTCSRSDILRQSADGSYPGTCRYKKLDLNTPGSALRVLTPETINLKVRQLNEVGIFHRLPASIRDFVVRKKDGMPAYQLCSLVDDVYFRNDLIVRGADLLPSTLAQLYLGQLLGAGKFSDSTFFHHEIVLDPQGMKMSKSAGATSVYQLRNAGKKPEAIFEAIGKMAGLEGPFKNWWSLGAALAEKGVFQAPIAAAWLS